MLELNLPLWGDVTVFIMAAVVIGVSGVKLAEYADRLADRTGLGEAVTGTIMLGLITALPGLAASVTAALAAEPQSSGPSRCTPGTRAACPLS